MRIKHLKKCFAFLSVLMVMACLCVVPALAEFDITAARKGVAAIYTCFETTSGQEAGFGSGTCFFVGPEGEDPTYLITNNHVISTWKEYGEGQLIEIRVDADNSITGRAKIRVYYDAKNNNYVEAYHVASDEIKDVAILRIDSPSKERVALPLLIPTEDMVGTTPVHAIGYPGISDNELVDPTTKWGLNDSSVYNGYISRLGTTSGTGRRTVQLGFSIQHGNSGGPLVNDKGQVLGITAMGVSNSEESVDYAINIQEAVTMLHNAGIDFTLISASQSDSDEKNSDIIIIDPHPKKDYTLYIVIGALAAVVIVAVVAVLVLRKNNNGGNGNHGGNGGTGGHGGETVSSKRPALICLAPQHNGMMMSLENRQVVAGRQGCDVVFRDGTPGVSARHCSVYWDRNSKDFIVTDLQSSFGTYLQNGQRLAPNVATHLKPGDSFYLGDSSNMMRVELV